MASAVRAAAPSLEPLRGRTVLITGATGLVGAFLTDALALAICHAHCAGSGWSDRLRYEQELRRTIHDL